MVSLQLLQAVACSLQHQMQCCIHRLYHHWSDKPAEVSSTPSSAPVKGQQSPWGHQHWVDNEVVVASPHSWQQIRSPGTPAALTYAYTDCVTPDCVASADLEVQQSSKSTEDGDEECMLDEEQASIMPGASQQPTASAAPAPAPAPAGAISALDAALAEAASAKSSSKFGSGLLKTLGGITSGSFATGITSKLGAMFNMLPVSGQDSILGSTAQAAGITSSSCCQGTQLL